jgi:hypothetical protein
MSDDVGARPKRALGNRASARQWVSFNQDKRGVARRAFSTARQFKPADVTMPYQWKQELLMDNMRKTGRSGDEV